MLQSEEVFFEEMPGQYGHLGLITLNRPAALNCLNHSMIKRMFTQLQNWSIASHIKAVVIRAVVGRAFCAGGDLRATYENFNKLSLLKQFFYDEYRLNQLIYHFPKPYVALLDGITMGGGAGISLHGSHRVATEHLIFAMPETGIGFFPDVGGTYFLSHLKNNQGIYLGLTGTKINHHDCAQLGLVQHCIDSQSLDSLLTALVSSDFRNQPHAAVTEIIRQFELPSMNASFLDHEAIEIEHHFNHENIEKILSSLSHSSHLLCQETVEIINKKSPTSLKVTLKALREAKNLDFDTCMRQEFRIATRFLERHDFREGIRALIIDKDLKPQWQPAKLANVTSDLLESYFLPLSEELV